MKKSETTSHILWLELLNQKSSVNSSKTQFQKQSNYNNKVDLNHSNFTKPIVKSKGSHHKTQEEYYDEIIFLKKNIVSLKGENEILKCTIRKSDEKLAKKDKELNEIINCFDNQKIIQDSSVNNFIAMKKLQQNIFQLKSEIKLKEAEILSIKNDIKYTKMNEIKIQSEIYLQEIKGLKQVIINFKNNEMGENIAISKTSSAKVSNSLSANEKHKLLLKKYKELINENKFLKKENEKLLQDELKKMEVNDKDIKKKLYPKEESEIDRLKAQCIELVDEKNNIQMKYEQINSKFKMLQDNYDLKENEYELLKKKFDEKLHNKVKGGETKYMNHTIKSYEIEIIKFVQTNLLSYFNRETILQDKPTDENVSDSEIIVSALLGYILREKLFDE